MSCIETCHLDRFTPLIFTPAGRRILLLPAWPPAWDVSFRLHAPGRTVVECAVLGGRLARLVVEPESRRSDIEVCAPFGEGGVAPAR